jgi:hypothetical protein
MANSESFPHADAAQILQRVVSITHIQLVVVFLPKVTEQLVGQVAVVSETYHSGIIGIDMFRVISHDACPQRGRDNVLQGFGRRLESPAMDDEQAIRANRSLPRLRLVSSSS